MKFLLSPGPQEEKILALLDANGTLLDATFLKMLQHSPENIAD